MSRLLFCVHNRELGADRRRRRAERRETGGAGFRLDRRLGGGMRRAAEPDQQPRHLRADASGTVSLKYEFGSQYKPTRYTIVRGRDRSTPGGSNCAKTAWTCSRTTASTSCSTKPTAASASGRRSRATARFWCATAISSRCATPNGCRAADDGALSRPLAACRSSSSRRGSPPTRRSNVQGRRGCPSCSISTRCRPTAIRR